MNPSPNRPPLWEVMYDAWCKTTDPLISDQAAVEHGTAAEIRALRDWLVPEEAPPLGPAGKAHMALRALLTTEADRAERGDHG